MYLCLLCLKYTIIMDNKRTINILKHEGHNDFIGPKGDSERIQRTMFPCNVYFFKNIYSEYGKNSLCFLIWMIVCLVCILLHVILLHPWNSVFLVGFLQTCSSISSSIPCPESRMIFLSGFVIPIRSPRHLATDLQFL